MPAVPDEGEPVESIEVEVKTGDVRFAGTDDDVHLRLGANLGFGLDKRLYDDFERGDRDTYSVPIDEAVRSGLRVGDITRLQIEKSRDGIAGGWRLAGVQAARQRPRRLRQPARRPLARGRPSHVDGAGLRPAGPAGTQGPGLAGPGRGRYDYGDDDQSATSTRSTAAARCRSGTRPARPWSGDGGRRPARRAPPRRRRGAVRYRLETITPEPIRAVPPPPPPPPPPLEPDLVVTAFTLGIVTVANLGPGPAGPFRLKAGNALTASSNRSAGSRPAHPRRARSARRSRARPPTSRSVDDLEQVAETNEANNVRDAEAAIC